MRDLVVRAQAGDVEAFADLTRPRTLELFAVAKLILRDEERARDSVQDALMRAWLDLHALRDPDRFTPWLRRLLINACYRAASRHRTRQVLELQVAVDGDRTTGDVADQLAMRDQLERGFRRLTKEQRAVLVARHYLDLSLAEIADILDVPVGTVQSRLHRATGAMRAALEADDRASDLTTEIIR